MTRNKNQYLIYYLKENILILDVFEYLEALAANTVDHLYDWNLINQNNKVKFKTSIIKEYLENKTKTDVDYFLGCSKKINCLLVCFYRENQNLKDWEEFFEDPKKFIKSCKRICKKHLPNFFEDKNEDVRLFQRIKGSFQDIPCLLPNGEDEEFLQKKLKKLILPS
jgi:hypothetical protein